MVSQSPPLVRRKHMPMLSCRVVSLIACSLAAPLLAQAPSPWVALPIGGATPTASVSADGKLVVFRDTSLSVFSAVTNQWHAHTPSLGTYTLLRKDILLVPEHDRWTAFSAYRGVFAVQMVNYFASSIQLSDSIAVVTEGTQLYVFSAFTGQWHARTIPAGATLQVGNRIVTVSGPTGAPLVGAFDVYTGQWHDLPSPPPGSGAGIGGGVAIGFCGGQLFGFSPLRGTWTQTLNPSVFPTPFLQNGHLDGELRGTRGLIFSAVTGTWTPSPFPPSAGDFLVASSVARAMDAGAYYALAAGQDTWVPLPGIVNLTVSPHILYGYGNGQAHAFSGILGTAATTPYTGTNLDITGRGHTVKLT